MLTRKALVITLSAVIIALVVQADPDRHKEEPLISCPSGNVSAVPFSEDIGGVHILLENNVDSETKKDPVFLLLTKPRSFHDVMAACASLGEGSEVQEGFRDQLTFRFYGIRYAEPPIGSLRFQAPRQRKAPSVKLIVDATEFGSACMQLPFGGSMPSSLFLGASASEDCLFLNVYTPTLKSKNKRGIPVMVYVHGGSYTSWAASSPIFESGNLASRGEVVVVTFNYRLNVFGLFQNMDKISRKEAPGNLALRDQIAALTWVKENIAAFGGDPKQVTIFGESAGATSMRSLLAAPAAFGLYRSIIFQSDMMGLPFMSNAMANDLGSRVLNNLGCAANDLVCAQSKTATEITAAEIAAAASMQKLPEYAYAPAFMFMRPVVDGDLITPMMPNPIAMAEVASAVANFTGDNERLGQLLRSPYYQFDPSDKDTLRNKLTLAETDFYATCPIHAIARQLTQHNPRVYVFQMANGVQCPSGKPAMVLGVPESSLHVDENKKRCDWIENNLNARKMLLDIRLPCCGGTPCLTLIRLLLTNPSSLPFVAHSPEDTAGQEFCDEPSRNVKDLSHLCKPHIDKLPSSTNSVSLIAEFDFIS
ncbi:MAG: Carboxylesterase family-domain-containing protein [Linnemannia gamsii]|nr:MAG: Carboxylesterase family-domain-containing protein [Linnemannia gamsii]